jgi:hypothetical protein
VYVERENVIGLKIILTMSELGWCYIFWSIVCLNKWLTCETDKLGISSWCFNWTFTPNYKLRFEFNLDLKLRTTRRKTGNRKGIRKIEPCWANSSPPAHAHNLFTSPDGMKRAPPAQLVHLALAHAASHCLARVGHFRAGPAQSALSSSLPRSVVMNSVAEIYSNKPWIC